MLLNNMLVTIKNAQVVGKIKVESKVNKLCINVLELLAKLNYIDYYILSKEKGSFKSYIYLRYHQNIPIISFLKLSSKPSKQIYCKVKNIWKIKLSNTTIGIFSTSKGVKTHIECLKENIGGELLFIIR